MGGLRDHGAGTGRAFTSSHFLPPAQSILWFLAGSDLPHHVRWSPNGRELVYNPRPTGNEAVGITTEPRFAFGKPVPVPRLIQGGPPGTPTPYDVIPDGRQVGFITAGSTQFSGGSANQVQVVLNWHEELKRLAPTRSRLP